MGQQFKRRRPPHVFTPGQMLQMLQQEPQMVALLQHSAVWLAVTPRTAWLLDMCCTGQMEGGPGTAQDVADTLGLELGPPPDIPEVSLLPQAQAPATSNPTDPALDQHDYQQQQREEEVMPMDEEQAASPAGVTGSAGVSLHYQDRHVPGPMQAYPAATADHGATGGGGGPWLPGDQGRGGSEGGGVPATAEDGRGAGAQDMASLSGAPAAHDYEAFMRSRREALRRSRDRAGTAANLPPGPPWAGLPHAWVAIRLTLEEAFFLQHVLGCLRVRTVAEITAAGSAPLPPTAMPGGHGSPESAGAKPELRYLTDEELWTAFRAIRPNFPLSYVGYHHLKCKGWLPRSGLLYGVDFVAYSLHPSAAHSHFSILLLPTHAADLPPAPPPESVYRQTQLGLAANGTAGEAPKPLPPPPPGHYPMRDWHDLQITARVAGTVSKKLLLLYLVEQPSSPGPTTPACIWHFSVEERIVRRWVPNAARA